MRLGPSGPTIANSSTLTFKEGDDVTIICDVDGGDPPVNQVAIICGKGYVKPHLIQSDSSSATLTFKAAHRLDGGLCRCFTTHSTGCYRKITEFVMEVQCEY